MAWMICRSGGSTMTRAASRTRSHVARGDLAVGWVMAIRALLFSEAICSPVTPT